MVATWIFAAIEVAAGLQAHSLALLSDAGHNFTDALALLLAWFGVCCNPGPPIKSRPTATTAPACWRPSSMP